MFLNIRSNNSYDLDLSDFWSFCQKLEVLFGKVDIVNLIICDSHEDLEQNAGKKSGELPNWVIGLTKGNCIYLRTSEEIQERQMKFETIFKHEIVHIFINKFSNDCPTWLDEGIAQNLSEDDIDKKEHGDISLVNPYDLFYESGLYFCSKLVVRKLFEIYGVSYIINRLKSCENFKNDDIFGYNSIEKLILTKV